MKTEIYDTTLRDGSQQEGISLTVGDKLRIATLLDELGVDYVEGGWPGANPKDDEFFRRAQKELDFDTATLVAFGSTRRPRGNVADDPQLQALLASGTEIICLVGKSWDYHVREALRTDLDEGLRMVSESIEYLRSHDRRVFFDAEHFFDGFRSNPEFALRVLQAATEAGAERLVLCDTNGGTLPSQILDIIGRVQAALPQNELGVHFHDDVGCAVASSLVAVEAGVRQVQGCINGYGERTGNADLSTLIPDLVLKMGNPVLPEGRLELLSPVAHHVADVVNIALDPHHPYVGTSAFTHKAGLHTSALARRSDAYEHENPSQVGNHTRMVVSELAGRASVLAEARNLGLDIDPDMAVEILQQVKDLEHKGYHFEAADGSFELLMRRTLGWKQEFFELESFRVFTDRRADEEIVAEATVKVVVNGERVVTTGEGVGPVHALDQALRSALRTAYPDIDRLRLTDYRVRVLDSSHGTGAVVRVLLETSDGEETWGTIGVHENVIEASWDALTEGLIVGLVRRQAPAGGV
jgi:2-isopropylmalate synthase